MRDAGNGRPLQRNRRKSLGTLAPSRLNHIDLHDIIRLVVRFHTAVEATAIVELRVDILEEVRRRDRCALDLDLRLNRPQIGFDHHAGKFLRKKHREQKCEWHAIGPPAATPRSPARRSETPTGSPSNSPPAWRKRCSGRRSADCDRTEET